MRTVKHVCKHCGKAELYTVKGLITFHVMASIVVFLSIIGILALIFTAKVGPEEIKNDLLTSDFTRIGRQYDDDLRALALNLTEGCTGIDNYCFTKKIYDNLSDLRYVLPSFFKESPFVYPPKYTYENGGDCKSTSVLAVALLYSIGIKSTVSCNNEMEHCVTVVPIEDSDGVILVDIANTKFVKLENEFRVWPYIKNNYGKYWFQPK